MKNNDFKRGKIKYLESLKLSGISLIVLVITIIVIVILSTAIIVTISNNNPIAESNNARYESDRDNIQSVFTMTVSKIMTQNRTTVNVLEGTINTITDGVKKTTGEVLYTLTNSMSGIKEGTIIFDKGENTDTIFYTGQQLPIYAAGKTQWHVDSDGVISLEVAGQKYGNGKIIEIRGGILVPELPSGATAIKWVNNVETKTTSEDKDWYNYVEQTSTTENGGTSYWANCVLEDGSYFVWIPRYAYKIDKTNLTIDVKFTQYKNGKDVAIDGTSLDGYIVHPAFTSDVNVGGWEKEIPGIWVAKFEAGFPNSNSQTGDIEISSSVSGYNLPIFKPNRGTYGSITIGNAYVVAKDYNNDLNSHMMKNSEWGAVAYLAHSKYGRNGTEVTINNSLITGNAGNEISANNAGATTLVNEYNTNAGVLASTTGNVYGIYDMSGGAYEFTAGYVKNPNETSIKKGKQLVNDGDVNISTKYKTVYGTTSTELLSRIGEGLWDVNFIKDAFEDQFAFPIVSKPFMYRGGSFVYAHQSGLFALYQTDGAENGGYGFRIVIIN